MDVVNVLTVQEVKNRGEALTCSFCTYDFNVALPHFSCRDNHEGGVPTSFTLCQPCFFDWIHGEVASDNVGFQPRRCHCSLPITHAQIQSVLDADQFAAYDKATVKMALLTDPHVLFCPGVDCDNAYFKPKRSTKRQCRKASCDQCETEFCCLCGELYTDEHKRMKCGPYKKWKRTHDEDTIALEKWRKTKQVEVKACPGCKKDVERTSGCNSMRCTNCSTKFCWACGGKKKKDQYCNC